MVGNLHSEWQTLEACLGEILLHQVLTMKESVTYQAIIEEGEAKGARKMVFLMGCSKFGTPSAEAKAALNALSDVGKLEKVGVRLLSVSSWDELLGLNGAGRRSRGRKKKD